MLSCTVHFGMRTMAADMLCLLCVCGVHADGNPAAGRESPSVEKQKKRTPAWCDRVLWLPGRQLYQLAYGRGEIAVGGGVTCACVYKECSAQMRGVTVCCGCQGGSCISWHTGAERWRWVAPGGGIWCTQGHSRQYNMHVWNNTTCWDPNQHQQELTARALACSCMPIMLSLPNTEP